MAQTTGTRNQSKKIIFALCLASLGGNLQAATHQVPYRSHWVSMIKKGKFFKYKRLEFSSPRVSGDQVFTGADSGYFFAVNKKTGRKLWRFRASSPINSASGILSDRVFFGDDKGDFYALSAQDGKLLWQVNLGAEISSAPALAGNNIYVATLEGRVVALDMENGATRWEVEPTSTVNGMTLLGNSTPVLSANADRLFVGFADGTLRCFATNSGKITWEKSLRESGVRFSDLDATPLIESDRLYLSTVSGPTVALSLKDGKVLWQQPMGSAVSMSLSGDQLYLSSWEGVVYALNKRDGSKIWETKLAGGALTAPVIFGSSVAVGISSKGVHFLDIQTGGIKAKRYAAHGLSSDPVLDGSDLYYFSNGGRLFSLKLIP